MSVPATKEGVRLLSGNEAFARGAFEAGVKVASAYPGTPSTEILENFVQYEGVYAEWAPNEKVAVVSLLAITKQRDPAKPNCFAWRTNPVADFFVLTASANDQRRA